MTARGDDCLAEHLAALDDRAPLLTASDADVGAFTGGAHVEDVDEMRRIAPGGKALDGDVPRVIAVHLVDQLDPNAVVVERGVVREPADLRRVVRDTPEHVGPDQVET